jgi:hypothetical protein
MKYKVNRVLIVDISTLVDAKTPIEALDVGLNFITGVLQPGLRNSVIEADALSTFEIIDVVDEEARFYG